ncbi:MAG: 2-iminoacetate synthase ThiH [Spirochaetales bacterium]|nr:2-iminoacetate synthase ThiH [Spirochaetales bacterium]
MPANFLEQLPELWSVEATMPASRALEREKIGPPEFRALLAAGPALLEGMAARARQVTRNRFGATMELYSPLYLSNECRSSCTYCGFSYENQIRRKTLSLDELTAEARVIYDQGIRNVLLLTGEDYVRTPVDYIGRAGASLRDRFASIGVEIYPLKTEEYAQLRESGIDSLAVYQETYDRERYKEVHLRGKKKDFLYRLTAPERAGEAGMRAIACGALLGLSASVEREVFVLGMHARYLMQRFWQCKVSISLPRLRPAEGFDAVPSISDSRFVQYLCALRLFLPDAGLNLSTRESPRLRDALSNICITRMSAGSRTEPGGYTGQETTEQFSIQDHRSVAEIQQMLEYQGLDPVMTDWNSVLV